MAKPTKEQQKKLDKVLRGKIDKAKQKGVLSKIHPTLTSGAAGLEKYNVSYSEKYNVKYNEKYNVKYNVGK